MIVEIQIGAVDEGAVFNKSIYGCLADEIHPQNALRAKKVSSSALIGALLLLSLPPEFKMSLSASLSPLEHSLIERKKSRFWSYLLATGASFFPATE